MSLFNNNKNKNKKKGSLPQSNANSKFFTPKSNINTKAASRSTKLTGGTNRGS
ncbi:MAG: hypothetical protein JNM68_01190 [Dinghuibacter sp.]|nr:hypothetical protein [Dinghuibacter sp.]